jgi:hypothetical protein
MFDGKRGLIPALFCYAMLAMSACDRHSGAMQSIEPGISRFPDAQLRI